MNLRRKLEASKSLDGTGLRAKRRLEVQGTKRGNWRAKTNPHKSLERGAIALNTYSVNPRKLEGGADDKSTK